MEIPIFSSGLLAIETGPQSSRKIVAHAAMGCTKGNSHASEGPYLVRLPLELKNYEPHLVNRRQVLTRPYGGQVTVVKLLPPDASP